MKFEADILSTSLSSRMGCLHIEHGRPLICWSKRCQNFILPSLWPLNSPDINPVYVVWKTAQDRVYQKQIKDMEELQQHVEEWNSLDQRVINTEISEWCKRLQVRIAADRWLFNYALSTLCIYDKMQLINIWNRNDKVIHCTNCMFEISNYNVV